MLLWVLALSSAPAAAQHARAPAGGEFVYRMQPGDNPWDLSERLLDGMHRWQPLVRLNGFSEPTSLLPGTLVRIPRAWLRREPSHLTIESAYGAVSIATGDGVSRDAVAGSRLAAGMWLRTAANSSATLSAADGSKILVLPESEIVFTRLTQSIALTGAGFAGTADDTTDIEVGLLLLKGAVENAVRPIAPGGRGRFEIRTPAGVAAVRGTEYRVASDERATRTETLTGAVALQNERGRVLLESAEGSLVAPGKRPEPPTPLLPEPKIDELPELIERLPLDLALPPVAGASAYRSQFAVDARFETVVSDELVETARVRARALDDGEYLLRVRAADAHGIEGLSAQ
ncbi:MAG TPA: FecR domain-containing protein, partial [Burkholderiaceae bacterium]|nr:FecR domain-containing protein [Burkholderiaceae bacterium]